MHLYPSLLSYATSCMYQSHNRRVFFECHGFVHCCSQKQVVIPNRGTEDIRSELVVIRLS